MIRNYQSFKDNIEKMVKIRSANYVESDCDILAMIETVYEDIQSEVLLDTIKQEWVTDGEEEFTIPNYNSEIEDNIIEKYTNVLDIVDEYDVSILDALHMTDDETWRWDSRYSGPSEFPSGTSIFFIRKKISDLSSLDPLAYGDLTVAILEGVMYFIQTAIPNQVDGQVGNYSYQRYYNAKKELANKHPQYRTRLKLEKQWL